MEDWLSSVPRKNDLVQNAGGDAAENSSDHAGSFAKTSDKNSSANCKGDALPVLILKERISLALIRSTSQVQFELEPGGAVPLTCNPQLLPVG